MIEVEIRAKLKNLGTTKRQVEKLGGKFVSCEKQVDKIFGRAKDLDSNHMIIDGRLSARIRQKNSKITTEFKEIRRNGAGHEFGLPVDNIEDGVLLLTNLDFDEAFTISKQRSAYMLKDFKICLDEVDKLGDFIEIEHTAPDGKDKEKAVSECLKLLSKIDSKATNEPKKYGDLMQELLNKNKQV